MSRSRDLTVGPIWSHLLVLAGPMSIGIVAAISVSLIDTYFVGQLGTSYLAALSFSFPVTMTVTSLSIGLGAGVASVVSRSIGAKDSEGAKRLTSHSLALVLLLVIIVAAIGLLTIEPLFTALGAKGETLSLIKRYMNIWYFSIPFLIIPMVANSVIRAIGDAFWPSLIMVLSSIINIALTPLFIFGWGPFPALNIEGAALGTLVAHVFTMIFAMWIITYREQLLIWKIPDPKKLLASWRQVIVVAIPAAVGNAINPLGIAIVTGILAAYGESIVAAYGVATRIESFAVIPMLALSAVIGPMAGQNWGAEKVDRVIDSLRHSFIASFGWACLLAVFFLIFSESIVDLFSADESVQQKAASYLHIVPLSVWGYGWVIISSGAFNAIGKSVVGLGFYLIRSAVLYVPLSFIASMLAGTDEIFIAIAVTNVIAGICVAAYALIWLNKQSSQSTAQQGNNSPS